MATLCIAVRTACENSYDPEDDYPLPCIAAAQATVLDPDSLGVVLGGSGNGEQMAANLVDGARAALAWNHETAILARSHNNANVIVVGVRQHDPSEVVTLIETFVAEPFLGSFASSVGLTRWLNMSDVNRILLRPAPLLRLGVCPA
jgi:RpiB/LacA/LacB family sugar-phosphate isomerase